MTSSHSSHHPDLDTLLTFAEDQLTVDEAAAIAGHLEDCVQCRLEIKRFRRFDELGDTLDEDQEAQWDRAELELARAWRQEIQPTVAARRPRLALLPRSIWLVPAAAAAVVAFIFLQPSQSPEKLFNGRGAQEIVRGADGEVEPQITLNSPSGELELPPEQFEWQTDRQCENFTLEIFTADLQIVYFQTDIKQQSWAATEELVSLLEPDIIYLWNVRGYRQLQVVAESGNGWFRVS